MTTSVGGINVLEASGSGALPPLVLLHGLSSAGVHFIPLLGRLRPHVSRLIIPDLPGHGFSDTPANGLDSTALRTGTLEALDAVVDEPAIVFGNSLGGLAAIQYAIERPGKVLGLILASPGGAAMDVAELSQLARTFSLDRHADALEFVDRLLAKRRWTRQLLAWGVRRQFEQPNVRALLDAMTPAAMLRAEQIAALAPPVLFIWGRHDRILPASNLAFFKRHLPAGALIEEPEIYGHTPFLDDPDALARRIVAFAASLARPVLSLRDAG